MSIEDRLRDSLRRRADAVRAHPDLDDVVERTSARDRRTRRLLTAGLVVALIAGPLAGFAVGATRDDGHGDVATGGGTARQEVAGSAGDAAVSALAPFPGGPLEKLFSRTTSDGVTIPAFRSASIDAPATPACPPGAECASVSVCDSGSMIVGELSTDAAVAVASGVASAAAGEATGDDITVASASWGTFGVQEGAPARWVIASVNADVVRVRATYPGGATDEMEPVDGIVVLVSQVDDAERAGATLEALDDDGTVVHRIDIVPGAGGVASASSASGSSSGSAESSAQLRTESSASGSSSSANASSSVSSSVSGSTGATTCLSRPLPPSMVPPGAVVPTPSETLPAPGEQPAEVTSARTAIEHAYAIVYDGTRSAEEKQAFSEDPSIYSAIRPQIDAGGFAQQAKDASAKVTDVVFTSPTTAAVRYDIAVTDWTNQFPGQIGKAVLVDGAWKVARETFCRDIGLAMANCPSK